MNKFPPSLTKTRDKIGRLIKAQETRLDNLLLLHHLHLLSLGFWVIAPRHRCLRLPVFFTGGQLCSHLEFTFLKSRVKVMANKEEYNNQAFFSDRRGLTHRQLQVSMLLWLLHRPAVLLHLHHLDTRLRWKLASETILPSCPSRYAHGSPPLERAHGEKH